MIVMTVTSPKASPDRIESNPPSLVKNPKLLRERRLAVIEAAVKLFTAHGFHKTTTRRIAEEAGMGVGSLYDYVRSKEDILCLVTEHIHGQVEERLKATLEWFRANVRTVDARAALIRAVSAYFTVCHDLADDILLIYQESKSLPPASRRSMLERETRISGIFEELIRRGMAEGCFTAGEKAASLWAEDIVVLGHMWTFRRWRLARKHGLEEYTRYQTALILSGLESPGQAPELDPAIEPPGPFPGERDKTGEDSGLESLLRSLRNC